MASRTIGLFGGTFDPPHCGHWALAQAALEQRLVDELWFVPVGIPVHRRLSGCADAATRREWLSRLAAEDPRCRVWDWEMRQSAPVPAIATLREFARRWPDWRAAWLMGADALAGLTGWIEYPAHRSLCDLIVFNRAGSPCSRRPDGWQPATPESWPDRQGYGHCLLCPTALPDVSATALRERAARGESLAGWVPECIRQDIERRYRHVPENKEST